PAALTETHRVLSKNGRAFIQVYPWYHCLPGSHLTDFIDEPFFHLKRPVEWVNDRLEQYAQAHPEQRSFVMTHMAPCYRTLNRYSADMFYREVVRAGFQVIKARVIAHDFDLSQAPPDVKFSELMICGTILLLRKR